MLFLLSSTKQGGNSGTFTIMFAFSSNYQRLSFGLFFAFFTVNLLRIFWLSEPFLSFLF